MSPAFTRPPGYAQASYGGHGTLEMKEVVQILENCGISCCIAGASALVYCGAGRVRDDWELCVPTESLERAVAVLTSAPHNTVYKRIEPSMQQYQSLHHTFPRFKLCEYNLRFRLLPAEDCHIVCEPTSLEYSEMGIPCPKLAVYAQSLLDTRNLTDLEDLVDGMNLTEDWGEQNLNLDGFNDVEWAKRKNEKMRSTVPPTSMFYEMSIGKFDLKKTWNHIVRNKEQRIGLELPKAQFATRFFLRSAKDPRLTKGRIHC